MTPTTVCEEASCQVTDDGSPLATTWLYVASRTVVLMTSWRTSDQPGGVVTVGDPRSDSEATRTSPVTALVGTGRGSDNATADADENPWKVMPPVLPAV